MQMSCGNCVQRGHNVMICKGEVGANRRPVKLNVSYLDFFTQFNIYYALVTPNVFSFFKVRWSKSNTVKKATNHDISQTVQGSTSK